jgi:hypothetical protein
MEAAGASILRDASTSSFTCAMAQSSLSLSACTLRVP